MMSATRRRLLEEHAPDDREDRVVCPECEGLRTFFSDTGPAPRKIACDHCGGEGGWRARYVPVELLKAGLGA